ncbi:efflux RND transporter periplasmic adaptor subunit [Streptosporangium sp. NPDC003464]
MRPTNLPKPLRTGGLALAALVLVGAGVIYTLDDGSAPAPRVELASARRGTVTAEVSAAGNTVEDSTRELAFGGSGTVTKVYVKAGDKVGRGDVLARIGSAPARERYAAAKAQLSAAREALDGAQDAATSQTSQPQPQVQSQVQSQARTQGQQTQGQQTQGQQTQQARQQGTSGDPARQAACVPTATPGASARPTAAPGPSGTAGRRGTPGPDGTAGPGGTGGPTGSPGPGRTSAPAAAERPVAVAPAGGIAPAGYFLRPAGYFLGPARTPAPVSALSRARAETPAPTPTPEPTATPTPTPTPTEGSPEPAPTVTVTVTAAPTATATVTVTATPTVDHPPASTGPTGSGPTARPSERPEPGPSARPTSTTTAEPGASPTPTVGRTPGPRDTACPRQSPTQGADRRSGEDGGTGRTDTGGTGTGGQHALSVDQAEAEVKRAEADLTDAREELAGVRIVAPADGTVLSVAGAVGDSVDTGAFVTLGDLDELQVEALFTESDIGELKLGQRASITLATREGDEHTGTVTRIAPTATTTDRLVRYGVAVAFDKTPKGLMVGQTATVTVTVAESEQALYLPAQAVRSKAGGGSVVTVQGGVERAVRTGVRSDRYIEITAGLRENERVVLPGGTVTGGFPDSSWPTGA